MQHVLMIDDHSIILEGLSLLIRKKLKKEINIDTCEDYACFFEKIKNKKYDLYIVDIEMPDKNGIDIIKTIRDFHKNSKIMVFTVNRGSKIIEKVVGMEVKGYVLKDEESSDILKAISEILQGNTFFSQEIAGQVLDFYLNSKKKNTNNKNKLTKRENEVLKLIVEGVDKKDIAEKLKISVNTVNIHRKNIMGKLNIHNSIELTKYAVKEGIILID